MYLADQSMIDAYTSQGAQAILVGRFIDADGVEVVGPLTDRQIVISLEDLKRAPVRLLVAAGEAKTDAIRAVLSGGHCTHLVVDLDTGTRLAQD